jgi:hypothetical protein
VRHLMEGGGEAVVVVDALWCFGLMRARTWMCLEGCGHHRTYLSSLAFGRPMSSDRESHLLRMVVT